jgi:hypothetical protein
MQLDQVRLMSFPDDRILGSSSELSKGISLLIRRFLLTIVLAGPLALQPLQNAASAEFAKNESVRLILDEIGSKADGILDVAGNAGDFVSWRAAQQASALMDAWKRKNSARLDDNFEEVDNSTQNLFIKMDEALDKINSGARVNVDEAHRLTAEWSEAIRLMPEESSETELLDYQPRAFISTAERSPPLIITGRHLENVEAIVLGSNGQKLAFQYVSGEELKVDISGALQLDNNKHAIIKLRLIQRDKYRGALTEMDMLIWSFPGLVANLIVKQTLQQSNVESTTFSTVVHAFGKDTTSDSAVYLPHELQAQGWRVDAEKLSSSPSQWLTNIDGDHGRCSGLSSVSSNDQAVVAKIELGHSQKLWGERTEAHQGCKVTVPVKRVKEEEVQAPVIQREIGWNYVEKIKLPENAVSFEADLTLFNGRSYIVGRSGQLSLDFISISNVDNILLIASHEPVSF